MDEFFYNFFITNNKSGHKTREIHLLNKYPDIHKKIINFCDNDFLSQLPFIEKVWCFIHNQKSQKTCKECNNPLKFKRSLKEGYGEYCSLLCTNKNENHKNNVKITNKEKYGGTAPIHAKQVKDKIKETNISRYGVENTYQRLDLVSNGFIRNHGVDHVTKVPGVLEKQIQTNLERYGKSTILVTDQTLRKGHETKRKKFLNKYKNYDFLVYTGNTLTIKCDICSDYYQIGRGTFRHRDLYDIRPCTICNPLNDHTSFSETEVYEFVKSLYNGQVIRNDRKVLGGKELDIYIPEKKLAIEFNGLYWHTEDMVGKNYHIDKTNGCNESGVDLIHILEDEWVFKKEIVKSIIRNKMNSNIKTIFGRKCEIREVNSKETRIFLNDNHIQGFVGSKVKLGLYYDNELVSIMTFGGLRRSLGSKPKVGSYEMLRFCNKLNHNVIGGGSRLFKYFIKNYNPVEVVSYSDIRYFNGGVYEKLGFNFHSVTKPNYFYFIDFPIRENRFKYRKDVLIKEGFDPNMSESQIMFERGYERIWDCGNKKWVWGGGVLK